MASIKKTILVVEDDADSRQALTVMLEALGYTPLAFGSGKEALAGLPGQKVDLALLDIMMPDMNGYEVLRHLREMPDFKSIPVIMVSAKDKDSEILEGYIKHDADYYITKPFTMDQLQFGISMFLN